MNFQVDQDKMKVPLFLLPAATITSLIFGPRAISDIVEWSFGSALYPQGLFRRCYNTVVN